MSLHSAHLPRYLYRPCPGHLWYLFRITFFWFAGRTSSHKKLRHFGVFSCSQRCQRILLTLHLASKGKEWTTRSPLRLRECARVVECWKRGYITDDVITRSLVPNPAASFSHIFQFSCPFPSFFPYSFRSISGAKALTFILWVHCFWDLRAITFWNSYSFAILHCSIWSVGNQYLISDIWDAQRAHPHSCSFTIP